mgnify:FL=1
MGDFNSVSPVDKVKYGEAYVNRLRAAEEKHPNQTHLYNGQVDYYVHQSILDFGFVDCAYQDKNYTRDDLGARIDFIYATPDLSKSIVKCGFLTDGFTKKYSYHRPVELILNTK